MAFDPRAAKAALPGSNLLYEGHPGLRLSISDTKRSWIYRYKSPLDGNMRQIKIGVWPQISFEKAVVESDGYRKIRDSGQDPAIIKRNAVRQTKLAFKEEREASSKQKFTIRTLCDLYLIDHVKPVRSLKSFEYVKYLLGTNLVDIENLPVSELTMSIALDTIESVAVKGKAPVVAKNLRLELAAATSYAREKGKIPENTPNWWREIRFGQSLKAKLKSQGKKIGGVHVGRSWRALTQDELSLLISWLPNFSQAVDDAITIYLWTGARGSEIMQIEGWEVVEEADNVLWWVCPKHKTKNRHRDFSNDLRVPLFGRARAVIERRKDRYGDGYLWPSSRSEKVPYMEQESIGNRVREHQPRNAEKKGYPVLPVTKWTPHDLRRAARTQLSSLGCPVNVAEAILGHMPPGITAPYDLHNYDSERKEWLKRLSDHLESISRR